jgi:hypothetical protein
MQSASSGSQHSKYSFGPWALDSGPKSPVNTNLSAGHLPLRKEVNKGNEFTLPIGRKLFPKTVFEDYSNILTRPGGF